ncbi:MAG TPA: ABC transporter substrate-binding protein [Mollicutes bacterium]|nr:ABC transporter substrate-binding protein [Mollicutes bacterium]
MKKIIGLGGILLVIVLTVIAFNFYNKDDDSKLRTIKLAEVTHSPFYAPMYVAIEKGYFEEKGINIELILTSGANNVVAAVLSGDVEIGFSGPEATIYVYNEGTKDYVVTFAGLTKRDGQFIVSREKIDNFTFDDLSGKEVVAGRSGGMPILNFINAVENSNTKNVIINDSVDFANLTSAFISGEGDFVNLFEPNATRVENMGYGYVVASVGMHSGEVPYTAFNAKKSFVENNKELINDFREAINKALIFTKENDSKTIAKVLLKQFPDTSLNELTTIVNRYKEADSWLDSTFIEKDFFTNLQDMIIDGGFINSYVPFEDLVFNE